MVNVVRLNRGTQRAEAFVNSYNRASATKLGDIYDSYSSAKAQAEVECRRRMVELGAKDFRIMSGNTYSFTCGYKTDTTLYVETSCNTYCMDLI